MVLDKTDEVSMANDIKFSFYERLYTICNVFPLWTLGENGFFITLRSYQK